MPQITMYVLYICVTLYTYIRLHTVGVGIVQVTIPDKSDNLDLFSLSYPIPYLLVDVTGNEGALRPIFNGRRAVLCT